MKYLFNLGVRSWEIWDIAHFLGEWGQETPVWIDFIDL
jgi:hypothetical protein